MRRYKELVIRLVTPTLVRQIAQSVSKERNVQEQELAPTVLLESFLILELLHAPIAQLDGSALE